MLSQFKALIVSFFMAADLEASTVKIEDLSKIREMSCLSHAIYGEAGNQPFRGKLAVGHVIVNRTNSDRFPSDICSVIRQRHQFDFLKKSKWIKEDRPAEKKQMESSIKAAFMILYEEVPDPTKGSLFFVNPKIATDTAWLRRLKRVNVIGEHAFYNYR